MTQIFLIIEAALKAFKAWELFIDWMDQRHRAQMEERRAKRDAAIDESTKADSDEAIFDSQDDIVDNRPRP